MLILFLGGIAPNSAGSGDSFGTQKGSRVSGTGSSGHGHSLFNFGGGEMREREGSRRVQVVRGMEIGRPQMIDNSLML
jgi:hypothetical protein